MNTLNQIIPFAELQRELKTFSEEHKVQELARELLDSWRFLEAEYPFLFGEIISKTSTEIKMALYDLAREEPQSIVKASLGEEAIIKNKLTNPEGVLNVPSRWVGGEWESIKRAA